MATFRRAILSRNGVISFIPKVICISLHHLFTFIFYRLLMGLTVWHAWSFIQEQQQRQPTSIWSGCRCCLMLIIWLLTHKYLWILVNASAYDRMLKHVVSCRRWQNLMKRFFNTQRNASLEFNETLHQNSCKTSSMGAYITVMETHQQWDAE